MSGLPNSVAEERAAISEAEEARREQEFERLGEWLQAHMEENGLDAEEVRRLIEDAEQIKALFDLQHKRAKAARAAWRRDTGCKEFVNPDLGALLEHFLMLRRELIQLHELLRRGLYESDGYADAMERLDKIFG